MQVSNDKTSETAIETAVETVESPKDAMLAAETQKMLQSFELKLKSLEMKSTQSEYFLRRHAQMLSIVGFVLLSVFAWYQQTQEQAMRLSLLGARTTALERSITGDEGKSIAVESRLTRLETQITEFVGSQRETNREIKQMVELLLSRSLSPPK